MTVNLCTTVWHIFESCCRAITLTNFGNLIFHLNNVRTTSDMAVHSCTTVWYIIKILFKILYCNETMVEKSDITWIPIFSKSRAPIFWKMMESCELGNLRYKIVHSKHCAATVCNYCISRCFYIMAGWHSCTCLIRCIRVTQGCGDTLETL